MPAGRPIGPGISPLPERQPRILAVEGARWGFSGLESLVPPTGALAGIVISVMGAATLVLPELIDGRFQPVSAPPTTPGPTMWPHERPRAGGAGRLGALGNASASLMLQPNSAHSPARSSANGCAGLFNAWAKILHSCSILTSSINHLCGFHLTLVDTGVLGQ
jgi:hypothetical protein